MKLLMGIVHKNVLLVCVCMRNCEYHPHTKNTTDYILLHMWYSNHCYITYEIASDLQATQACQMETLYNSFSSYFSAVTSGTAT